MSHPKREIDEFIEMAVTHDGDGCLVWPFSRDQDGYARITPRFGTRQACRYVCERVRGPAKSASEQAAHSCGNGSGGCISGFHLTWKTPRENCADRKAHGTERTPRLRGENQPMSKLKENDINNIRASKERVSDLAAHYRIGRSYIYAIKNRKTWKHVI